MVNQKLGYAFNQSYRWETGRTRIKWAEFVRYCAACKVDLKEALGRGLMFFGSVERADLIITHLIGKRSLMEVSKSIGISRFSLQDWVARKSDPPLEEMIKIFRYFDGLIFTIEVLVGEPMIPSLAEEHRAKKNQLSVFYDNPICGAVMMCLELKGYRELKSHEDGFIAGKLGISKESEAEFLRKLAATGAIELKNGKYQKISDQMSARGNFEGEKKLRSFWVKKGLDVDSRRREPSSDCNFGFAIFSVTADKQKRIREALMDFGSLVSKIAREPDEGGTKLNVFTVQLFEPSQ